MRGWQHRSSPEAAFLDVIGTKVLRVFLLANYLITVASTIGPPPPLPHSKSGLKLVCNVNIVYGNLQSEDSQNYAQKPQRNCTFMNSASGESDPYPYSDTAPLGISTLWQL